jgi:hypothetical protein
MAMTLVSLLVPLRVDLRDSSDTGQWSLADKVAALNSAIKRTLVRTRTYKTTLSTTVVSGTHTYDIAPIFLPTAIRLGDSLLDLEPVGSMAMLKHNWDAFPSGQPTKALSLGGHQIRVWPTPDDSYAGMVGTVAAAPTAGGTGYAVGDTLSITTGGSGAIVKVVTVNSGVVTAVELDYDDDNQGVRKYHRGIGYTTGTGKATTKVTGSGADNCTVNISALAKLEAYGPSWVENRGTGMIETLTATPTAAGTGYEVNDILTLTEGVGGQAKVTAIGALGAVSTVSLLAHGTGYTAGTGKATGGGHGASCTLAISAIKDGTYEPITEISDAFEYAIRLAAQEECWRARAWMPGGWERAEKYQGLWLAECDRLTQALGLQ